MAIVIQAQRPVAPAKIYASFPIHDDGDPVEQRLAQLSQMGGITDRDERLLEYLREVHVLSLDQVRRLLWPEARAITAYQRLYRLQKNWLVAGARTPRSQMEEWGLAVCKVYTLGEAGRLWLREEVDRRRAAHMRRDQVLHDLLVAEVMVRLVEAARQRGEGWGVSWSGATGFSHRDAGPYDRSDVPLAAPDGLGVVRQRRGSKVAAMPLFVELDASREAHGRTSSDWGRKVVGYDRLYDGDWQAFPELSDLPTFPVVAVVTHGEQRLLNLAAAITEHRRQPVAYYLALWEDLVTRGGEMLVAPAWLVVTPDGQVIGEERAQRQSLLGEPRKKKRSAG